MCETLGCSLGARFDEIASANRQRIAIRTPRREIGYGDLATLSDQIARLVGASLANRHAVAPSPVAVLLPQGIEAIAAQLGILKAGGCYVPLDPRHPGARLRQTAEHSQSSLVITNGRLFDLAAEVIGDVRAIVDVDEAPRAGPVEARLPKVAPDSIAYIYYTSGSTGRPKGVADTHRNVLHNVLRYTRNLGIGRDDRLTLLQSPAFSGAVSSTYGALLNGATLCPYDLHEDGPDGLADWLTESGVTIYHSVPALFRTLVAGRRRFPQMRIIRLEGDRALARDAELFKGHFPSACTLVNGLGTTETGIVRQFFVSHDTAVSDGLLPVGYAVTDVEAFVVDEAGYRIADGVVGEIAVRSRFLAVGYWRDPRLTAEKFLSDADGGLERTYRTGDLGRMRHDGCLEHLGRCDSVLKIRGHTVDLSEVEQALVAISGVTDAAVTVRQPKAGESELVAFVVARVDPPPTPAQIKIALSERLPDFMMPSAIVFRDVLPLTPYAKVDRAAIAALAADLPAPQLAHGGMPAQTTLEREIAAIWGSVLGREAVPANVAFLDIGGDSLQAMQILLRVRERLGIRMTPQDFFALPTVATQARFLEPRTLGTLRNATQQ